MVPLLAEVRRGPWGKSGLLCAVVPLLAEVWQGPRGETCLLCSELRVVVRPLCAEVRLP